MTPMPTRRHFLLGLSAYPIAGMLSGCSSDTPEIPGLLDNYWQDLIPEENDEVSVTRLGTQGGMVQHGELSTGFTQPEGANVVAQLNNKQVRIPGFMVPVVNTAEGVTAFLLVPYVGACVHVPPPPPNQLVFVTSEKPFEMGTLFQPIRVSGLMETMPVSTKLASAGYSMAAEYIELYTEQLS